MVTEFFENRGVDMDVDTEFFKNLGVDMDTAWNRCPPNSGLHFFGVKYEIYQYELGPFWSSFRAWPVFFPRMIVYFSPLNNSSINGHFALPKSVVRYFGFNNGYFGSLGSSLSPCPKSCPKSCPSPNPCPKSWPCPCPCPSPKSQKIACPCPSLLRTRTRTRTHVRSRVRVLSSLEWVITHWIIWFSVAFGCKWEWTHS